MEHERIDDEEVSDEQLQRLGVEEYSQSPIIIPRLNGFDNDAIINGNLAVNGSVTYLDTRAQVLENEVEILKVSINTLEDKVAELEQMIWQLQEKDNEQDVP